jgi:hypothetical protein
MLSHDWLGTFPLFLVPSDLSGVPSACTAIFAMLNETRPKPLNWRPPWEESLTHRARR